MSKANKNLKVALVHDHLMRYGGAERVLFAFHGLFPKAPIYTLFYDEAVIDAYFPDADIRTSFLQKLPKFLRRRFKYLAPLAIPAIENMDLSDYNLVISSCAFFAKGVITRPDAIHLCYCHTPTKYLWGSQTLGAARSSNIFVRAFEGMGIHMLRLWDFNAALRVDHFVTNSKNVRSRIQKYYRKDAFVVYPPVDRALLAAGDKADPFSKKSILASLPKDFFLIVSQLYPHKEIDIAVQAFQKLKYPLVIIGDGPERSRLKALAGENVIFLGRQPDDIVSECYQLSYAYVHAGEEDFGISPVEAMLYGKPVLAYRAGGVQESVVEGVSGEFFDDLHPAVLADGVRRIKINYTNYNPVVIKNIASKFSKERFGEELRRVIKRILVYEWETESDIFSERTKEVV